MIIFLSLSLSLSLSLVVLIYLEENWNKVNMYLYVSDSVSVYARIYKRVVIQEKTLSLYSPSNMLPAFAAFVKQCIELVTFLE